jgi:arabinoxylan arabinofuranohydrolase
MLKKSVLATAVAGLALCAPAMAANPLFSDIFTADPAALVDGNRVYLYVGRDEARAEDKDYLMKEWRVYSSCDMKNWKAHGVPLNVQTFAWAKADAWAADIAKRNGKYYFYATVEHKDKPGKAIGVAVSDSPAGPFKDARGTAIITNDMTKETDISWDDIDPAVFIDTNGQAYLYWGNQVMKYVKLKPNMIEADGPIHTVAVPHFTEATYLHKHRNTYYLSWSREFPELTAYSTGPTATGPWTYRGVIMDKNAQVKTIHHAIVDFNNKSYIFYHNDKLPGGGEYRRSVAVEELHYNPDGTIKFIPQTAEGPDANPAPGCQG